MKLVPFSLRLLMLVLCGVWSVGVWGQYVVNFEGSEETKGSFASGNVTLSGIEWNMTEALIGTLADDWKNGARSARMRGYGTSSMTMFADKPGGAGTISFQYRRFGTDTQVAWRVEYSTNGGSTWIQVGSDFTAPNNNDVQTFSETVNLDGNVRIRITSVPTTGTANRRLNIDDISITNYDSSLSDDPDFTALYDFENTLSPSGLVLNMAASDVSISSGTISFQDGTDDGGTTIGNSGSWNQNDFSASEKYLQYTISPSTGYQIEFDQMNWRFGRTSAGPTRVTIQYSFDGFATPGITVVDNVIVTSTNNNSLNAFSISAAQLPDGPQTLPLTIRIWGHNASGTGNLRFNNFRVIATVTERPPCTNTTHHFRTQSSGGWNNPAVWESSVNGTTGWANAVCEPDAATAQSIRIRDGHTVSFTNNLSIDQLIIENGGVLNRLGGRLTVMNGAGDDMLIQGGGVYRASGNGEYNEMISYASGATIRVQSNGTLEANFSSGANNSTYGIEPVSRIIWEDQSVFLWNPLSSIAAFSSANLVYFPGVAADVIPILRVTNSPSIGSVDPTTILGRLEIIGGNIILQRAGTKTIRNGIAGNGSLTQNPTEGVLLCGEILINGATSQFGLVSASLNNNGLRIADGSVCTLQRNTVVNDGEIRVTNPSTFNAQAFALSGTGSFRLNSRATFITSHASGLNGNLGNLNDFVTQTDREQTYIFERNGTQITGSLMPSEAGVVIIRNSSKTTLSANLSITNLTLGFLQVTGIGSELRASSNVTLNINGNRSLILENGGIMNANCLTDLTITTGGNSSTATFTGNGNPIRCYNFESIKSGSGGAILSPNTDLLCGNNFVIDYLGGSATFVDNANTISAGDDVRLRGNGPANFNFTGTLVMTLANSGSDQADLEQTNGGGVIDAELNNLTITSSNANADMRIMPESGTETIRIKGNFTVTAFHSTREIMLYGNRYEIGGNWSNIGQTRINEGTSTVVLDANGDQSIACIGGEVFYNLELRTSGTKSLATTNANYTVSNNLLITGAFTRLTQNQVGRTLFLGGDLTFTAGGRFADACYDNLSLETILDADQVYTTNGIALRCFDFRSTKVAGGLSLAASTPIDAKNNFIIKTEGTAAFTDGGNTITLGGNLTLTDLNDSQLYNGTIEMIGLSATNNINSEGNVANLFPPISNLTIAGSGTGGALIQPTSGNSITIKGNLTIENTFAERLGRFVPRGNTVYIGGTWLNHDAAGFTQGTSTIIFNGDDQSLGCSGGEDFHRLELASTGDLFFTDEIRIANHFEFINGRAVPVGSPQPVVQFAATATTVGASNASFVSGPVRRLGNTSFTYPTGSGTYYQAIALDNITPAGASFTARYVDEAHPSLSTAFYYGSLQQPVSTCDYWELIPTGNSRARVTLTYGNNPCNVVPDQEEAYNDISIAWYNELDDEWQETEFPGVDVPGFRSVSTSSPVLEGFYGFFALSSTNKLLNVLPITLLSFTAEARHGNMVQCNWATASEINNDFFTIERSVDGQAWEAVGTVQGAGNSNYTLHYHFADDAPHAGVSYYRLRQTDYDGTTTLSQVEAVYFGDADGDGFALLQAFRSDAGLSYAYTATAPYLILEVYDVSGRRLYGNAIANDQGNTGLMDLKLARGVYMLRLSDNQGNVDTRKFFY